MKRGIIAAACVLMVLSGVAWADDSTTQPIPRDNAIVRGVAFVGTSFVDLITNSLNILGGLTQGRVRILCATKDADGYTTFALLDFDKRDTEQIEAEK